MKDNIIQVYTGNGKGKTTAAFGVAFRAAGHDLKTLVIQFLKHRETGEQKTADRIKGITVERYGTSEFIIDGETSEEDHKEAEEGFKRAEKAITQEGWDIVILDELNLILYYDLIGIDKVLRLLEDVQDKEIIITGRKAPEELIEMADLVTSMEEIKHPYQKGFRPRKGIEF